MERWRRARGGRRVGTAVGGDYRRTVISLQTGNGSVWLRGCFGDEGVCEHSWGPPAGRQPTCFLALPSLGPTEGLRFLPTVSGVPLRALGIRRDTA